MGNGVIIHDDMSFLKGIGLCIMGGLLYAIDKISNSCTCIDLSVKTMSKDEVTEEAK
jgi:hypothetical protein